MAETFAELVREQRQPLPGGRFRYTQYESARRVGVHVSTWKGWELGRHLPRTSELLRFIEVFRLDRDRVFAAIGRRKKERRGTTRAT